MFGAHVLFCVGLACYKLCPGCLSLKVNLNLIQTAVETKQSQTSEKSDSVGTLKKKKKEKKKEPRCPRTF